MPQDLQWSLVIKIYIFKNINLKLVVDHGELWARTGFRNRTSRLSIENVIDVIDLNWIKLVWQTCCVKTKPPFEVVMRHAPSEKFEIWNYLTCDFAAFWDIFEQLFLPRHSHIVKISSKVLVSVCNHNSQSSQCELTVWLPAGFHHLPSFNDKPGIWSWNKEYPLDSISLSS